MNIIFFTLAYPSKSSDFNLYSDLMEGFVKEGHTVQVVTQIERRENKKTFMEYQNGVSVLRVMSLNITKVTGIEKVVSILTIESIFIHAVKKYLNITGMDLILYSTPPIMFERLIKYVKRKSSAKSCLMLKDIFPQNAVDMQFIKPSSLAYKFFRSKEVKLYQVSDFIGCMSEQNRQYLLEKNTYLSSNKVFLCPNSLSLERHNENSLDEINQFKSSFKETHNILQSAKIIVYGGNIGKPQGVEFIIKVLKLWETLSQDVIVIVGSGTEYEKLERTFISEKFKQSRLIQFMPQDEYSRLLEIADVGLIFLDKRFSIPNYPSRILDYMFYKLPVLAATDSITDIRLLILNNQMGSWVLSQCETDFMRAYREMMANESELVQMGLNSRNAFENFFTVENTIISILSAIGVDTNV